mgnify:CR=1 FL=1
MDFVGSVQKLFLYYKKLGEKAMDQVEEPHLFVQANEDCNSIAIIVQHLYGNMVSRWTDVLSTDGEKPWRNRDQDDERLRRCVEHDIVLSCSLATLRIGATRPPLWRPTYQPLLHVWGLLQQCDRS